jgi:hypothetical protein
MSHELSSTTPAGLVQRARALLGELAAAERGWLATQPYRLVHEHDMRRGRYVVRVKVQSPMPAQIAASAHDVVHLLRGALDALAAQLAGAPTRFPIFESLPLFAQRARKSLSRMSDEAQAAIEALQPYHAIGGFRNGPLWVLDQLDAAGAPRLGGSMREGAVMGVNTQRKVALVGEPEIVDGPFDDGAIVASVATKVVGADPKLDMFLRADFAVAYATAGPTRRGEVVKTLAILCDHVERGVIAELLSGG